MMMRVNLKTLMLVLVASVCSSLFTLWYYCGLKGSEWKTGRYKVIMNIFIEKKL